MLTVLFFFLSFFGFTQHEWEWSIHPEAHFKVLAPFALTLSTREVPTAFEPILYHQYNGGSVSDTSMAFAVVIDHYSLPIPKDSVDAKYIQELFKNAVDQLLTSLNAELIYMDFSGQADRDVCIWKAGYLHGKGVIRGNLIITGDEYYGLQAFGLEKDNPDVLMNKFLDSFRIIN